MAWIAPVIAAAGSIGSSIMGNQQNQAQTRDTNLMNSGLNERQIQFQEYMSNSAHQREVKDLIAAGLNPTLSAGGNGASSPSGAGASAVAPPNVIMPDFAQIASIAQEQQKINIQKQATAASVAKNLSETDLVKMKKILAQKGIIRANIEGKAASYVDKFINYLEKKIKTGPDNGPAVPKNKLYKASPNEMNGWQDQMQMDYPNSPRPGGLR